MISDNAEGRIGRQRAPLQKLQFWGKEGVQGMGPNDGIRFGGGLCACLRA